MALLEAGLGDPQNRPAIVYCGTRKDTEEVAQSLREAGLSAAGYHAGMDPDEVGLALDCGPGWTVPDAIRL